VGARARRFDKIVRMLQHGAINGVQLHFPTPVLIRQWPDAVRFHPGLRSLIGSKRQESQGVVISNRGGWQSADDLFLWGGDAVTAFTQWCTECVTHVLRTFHGNRYPELAAKAGATTGWRVNGWANVNHRGDWNATHNHPMSNWSGVHYLQVPADSGRLAFIDPRPNITMVNTGSELFDLFPTATQEIQPVEGMTVVFPSWLLHRVTTHEADGERVSIAFNFQFVPAGR
jgi:uncharacterized protein (TIGR02466 family)